MIEGGKEMALKKLIEKESRDPKELLFEVFINKEVKRKMDKQQEERPKGVFHCSNIIVEPEKFCIRKQIYDYLNHENRDLNPGLLRVFLQGIVIHEKWQDIFVKSGKAEKIEVTHYSKRFHLTATPDAIIKLWGKSWVVEIKSVRSEIFNKMRKDIKPISAAIVQANLYMWLTGIPRAVILAENKNTQDIKTFFIEFEPQKIKKYLEQHLKVLSYLKRKVLPKPCCTSCQDKRAKGCAYVNKCFGGK